MRNNIPSITALFAFEATARHLSFTRAAVELNLTQTAISHRIRNLEDMLHIRLFERVQNRIRLTDEGRAYLEAIKPALAQISVASDRFSGPLQKTRLRVACLSAFAIKCLIPALGDFRSRHGDVQLRVMPIHNADNLSRLEFDVAIWYGSGDWPGFDVHKLRQQEVFPVCSPRLLDARPLRAPKDLFRHTIIRNFSPMITDDWPAWLEHAGLGNAEFVDELNCDGSFLSVEAAVNGLGIFAARSEMVRGDLASGRLIAPFDIRLPSDASYYIVMPAAKSATPPVSDFLAWALRFFRDADDRPNGKPARA